MKVLILASNPRKDLNLDREIRDLKEVIEKSQNREQFEVIDELAVRAKDLQALLFKHKPQVVHFCGHGAGQQGLVFESDRGQEQWIRTEAISNLFRLFSSHVKCVLLNACYSEAQADAIVNHIDYVVGMRQEIRDDAAIAFAKGFYLALGYSASLEEAYEVGCNAIQLEIVDSSIVRSAGTETVRKAEIVDAVANTLIPEDLKPILKCRPGASPVDEWGQTKERLSQATREAIFLDVAQAFADYKPDSPSSRATPLVSASSTPSALTNHSQSSRSGLSSGLPQLLAGSLVICTLLGTGIYGYQNWQNSQQRQVRLQQAIELARQEKWGEAIVALNQIPTRGDSVIHTQSLLNDWSEQLLKQAEGYYQNGNVEKAVNTVQVIPENSLIYEQVQKKIESWNVDQQRLDKIRDDLASANDLIGAGKIMAEIQSSGLRQQAQEEIQKYNIIVYGNPEGRRTPERVAIVPSTPSPQLPARTNSETPKEPIPPEPLPNPPNPDDPIGLPIQPSGEWKDYKYGWLSDRSVTEADLEGKSAFELDVMRNSVYAKYGYTFRSSKLRAAFRDEPWYRPNLYGSNENASTMLTPQEQENRLTICNFQLQRNLSTGSLTSC